MNLNRVTVAVIGATAWLLPPTVVAQIGPQLQSGAEMSYPQSPQSINSCPVVYRGRPRRRGADESADFDAGLAGRSRADGQQMMDKKFVRTAAEGGIADVKLGTLAAQKGSPAVKEWRRRWSTTTPR